MRKSNLINLNFHLKPGFSAGDLVPNMADIYFEMNSAIVTNMFETLFVGALANQQFIQVY